MMTTCTSTGTSGASACPVTRSTSVSAISWPLPRSSPAAFADRAACVRAAWTATAWATGSSAETTAIASATGRIVTRRSLSARRARSVAAAASSRSAQARTRRSSSRSPHEPTPGPVGSSRSRFAPTTSASTTERRSGSRWLVPRATSSARRSLRTPALSAARVCGRCRTRAEDRFASRAPRDGDSRRARPTWAATPVRRRDVRRTDRDRRDRRVDRPGSSLTSGSSSRDRASSRAATHPSKSPASEHDRAASRRRAARSACVSTNRAVSRACSAAQAALVRSRLSIREISSASVRRSTSSVPEPCEDAATGAVTAERATPCAAADSLPNMCSSLPVRGGPIKSSLQRIIHSCRGIEARVA